MKLGELFVDLGVNSGGAFNTLTGFAFKFNQLADLAKNVGDALDSILGGTQKYAHNLNVFSQATAISRKSLQGMMIAAKENGGSLDDMVAKIQKYEDEINQFKMGEGNLGQRLSKLGITGDDIVNSDGRTLIAKILNQTNKIQDRSLRESLKRQEGFTTEQANLWQDYLSNMEKYDNDRRTLTEEEIKNLDKIDKFQKRIALDRQMALDKLRAKNSDSILQWTEGLNEVFKAFDEFIYGDKSFGDFLRQAPELLFGTTEEAKALGKVFGFISDSAKSIFEFVEKTGGFVADWVENGFLSAISNIGLVEKKDETSPKDTRSFTDKLKDKWNQGFFEKKGDYSDMRNLGLKGVIAGGNSDPRILSKNVERLKKLDDFLSDRGYKVYYTSAMGGSHKGGARSHASGNKIDFQLWKDGKFVNMTKEEEEYLRKAGYFGKGTGALGWEYNKDQQGKGHYDFSVGDFASKLLEDKVINNASKIVNSTITNTINTTDKEVVGKLSYLMSNTSDNLEALFSS